MAGMVESVHSILLELEFPVLLEDLRNPTETFMINIISEFFQRFYIDVAAIKRTTLEQNSALRVTNPENASIACLINLREAMAIIGNKIFIKDFSITDITTPGPKRTRKHLKFIANFTLYARNTMKGIQERIDEVLKRGEYINDLRKKKQSIIEAINTKAGEIGRKKFMNEELKSEIKLVGENIEKRKLHVNKIESRCKAIQEKKLLAIERNQIKRNEIKKLEEITDQLKGKVVKEPESIKLRLQELEEECNSKKEKRTTVQDMIQSKKPMIQNLENALAFVEKHRNKLPEVIDLQKKLIETNQMNESLKIQIEEAVHSINFEANRDREDEEKVADNEVKNCEVHCEEKLSKLRNQHNNLMIDKKSLERKIENIETQEVKLCIERDEIRGKIIEVDGEIEQFLRQCQELYIKELKDMELLHDNTEEKIQFLQNQLSNLSEN